MQSCKYNFTYYNLLVVFKLQSNKESIINHNLFSKRNGKRQKFRNIHFIFHLLYLALSDFVYIDILKIQRLRNVVELFLLLNSNRKGKVFKLWNIFLEYSRSESSCKSQERKVHPGVNEVGEILFDVN